MRKSIYGYTNGHKWSVISNGKGDITASMYTGIDKSGCVCKMYGSNWCKEDTEEEAFERAIRETIEYQENR